MIEISANPKQKIRAALLGRGMTLADWARNKKLKATTVTQILARYAGKNTRPKRGITKKVIDMLESELLIKVCGKDTQHTQ